MREIIYSSKWTNKTSQSALARTFSATLPMTNFLSPLLPEAEIIIKSAPESSAYLLMVSEGKPVTTLVVTL